MKVLHLHMHPMDHCHKTIHIFFLDPPQLVSPPHGQPNVGVKFVHPSPIQKFHTFEQLNMENLSH
jgi:hypothetical protein